MRLGLKTCAWDEWRRSSSCKCWQPKRRIASSQPPCEHAESDANFLWNITTGDEIWIYSYDPETKAQSLVLKAPSSRRPKESRQVRSKTKVLLKDFFDQDGVVRHEFGPESQRVNNECYLQVLRRFYDAVLRKRPEKWSSGTGKSTTTEHQRTRLRLCNIS